jgi:hypothetical protein
MSVQIDYASDTSNFSKPVHSSSKNDNTTSIVEEINKFPIKEDIKKEAHRIYKELGSPVHRGKKRAQLLFYCIYNGELEYRDKHPELEEDVDPRIIKDMVDIKNGMMRRAMSMFSETQTGYRPKSGKPNPLGLIKCYCEENHISSEMIPTIRAFGQEILDKDPSLLGEFPQTVAAGLIKYVMLTRGDGKEPDNEAFSKKIGLSQATINTMYKRIAKLDNAD